MAKFDFFSRGSLSFTSFLSAELEREIHVFFSSFLISGSSYAAHDVRVRRLPRRAEREMASHLKVHAILSKWPLTQYCMNLKMANQRLASAAAAVAAPPAARAAAVEALRARNAAASTIVMILGAR